MFTDRKRGISIEREKTGQDAIRLRAPDGIRGQNARCLLPLFGGQGSINVNSWAKDSRHIAFVSYEWLPGTD